MKTKYYFSLVLLTVAALLLPGCKGKLAPGGAYAPASTVVIVNPDGTTTTNVIPDATPDLAFYSIDASFDFAYSALDAAFKFEHDNRALLWKTSPDIKHALDAIRPQAWDVARRYAAARAVYVMHPLPPNLDALTLILSETQNLAASAAAALPKGN